MREAVFVLIMLVATVEISHQQAGGDDDRGMNPYPDVLPTTNCQSLPDYFNAEALNNLNTRFGCSFEFVRAESMYKDVSRRSLYQFFRMQSAQLANGSCPSCTGKHSPLHEPDIHYSNVFLMRQNWFLEYSAYFLFAKYRCPFNMSAKIAIEDFPDIGNNNLGTLPELAGCDSYFAVTSMKLRPDEKQEDSVAFLVQSLTTTNDLLRTWNDTDYTIASASHYGCAIIVKDNVHGISGLGEALQNDRAAYLACLFIAYDALVSYRGDLNDYTCDRNYGLAEYINSVQTTLCLPINTELIPEDLPFDIACEEKYVDTEMTTQPAITSAELLTTSAEFSLVSTTPTILPRTSAVISPELDSTISEGSDTRWTSIGPRKGWMETKLTGASMLENEEWVTRTSPHLDLLASTPVPSTETAIISPERIIPIPTGSNAERMKITSEKWRTKMKPAGEWGMRHSKRPDFPTETASPFTETGIRTSEREGYGMQNLLRSDLPKELVVSSSEITTVSAERTFTISPDAERITVRSEMEQTEPKPADITSKNQEWGQSNLPRQCLTTKLTVSSAATTIISPEQTANISEESDAEWITDRTGTSKSEDWVMWHSKQPDLFTEPAVSFTETEISTSTSEGYMMQISQQPNPPTEPCVPATEIPPEWTVTIPPEAEWITVRPKDGQRKAKLGGINTSETKVWGMPNSPLPDLTTESTISLAKNTINSPEWTITISEGSYVKLTTITTSEGPTKATPASISVSENEKWAIQNSQQSDPSTSTSLPSTRTAIISRERNATIPTGLEAEWIKMKPARISISKNRDWRMRTSEWSNLPAEPAISFTGTTRRTSENEAHEIQNSERPGLPTDALASLTEITITSTEQTVSISPVAEWITFESERGQQTKAKLPGISMSKIKDWGTSNSPPPDLTTESTIGLAKNIPSSSEQIATISEISNVELVTITPGKGPTKAILAGIRPSENEEWVTRTSPRSDLLTSTPVPSTGTAIISSERIATISTRPQAEWMTITSRRWRTKAKSTSVSTFENENWRIRSSKQPQPDVPSKSTVSFTKTEMRTSENEGDGMQTSRRSDPSTKAYVPSTEIPAERTVTISPAVEWVKIRLEDGRTNVKPVGISTSKNEEWGQSTLVWQEDLTTTPIVSSAETATTTISEGADPKLVTVRPEKEPMKATPAGITPSENKDWVRQNSPRPDLLISTSVPSIETANISPVRIATISTGSKAEWGTLTSGKWRMETKPASISTPEDEDQRMWYSKRPNIPPESAVPFTETGIRASENKGYEMENSQRPGLPTVPPTPSTDITIVSTERTATISEELNVKGITAGQGEGSMKGALASNSTSGIEVWRTLSSQRPDRLTRTPVPPTGTAIIPPEWTGTISTESDAEWMTGKWRTKIKPAGISTSKNEDRGIWKSKPPDLPLEPAVLFTETGIRTSGNEGYGIPIVSTERTVAISPDADGMKVKSGKWRTEVKLANVSTSKTEEWGMLSSPWPDPTTKSTITSAEITMISPQQTVTILEASDPVLVTVRPGEGPSQATQPSISTSKNAEWGLPFLPRQDLTKKSTLSSAATIIISSGQIATISDRSDGGPKKATLPSISTSENEEWATQNSQRSRHVTRTPVPSTVGTTIISPEWTGTISAESNAEWMTNTSGTWRTETKPTRISTSENEEWKMQSWQRPDDEAATGKPEPPVPFTDITIIPPESPFTVPAGSNTKWITMVSTGGRTEANPAGFSVSENEEWMMRSSQWPDLPTTTPIPSIETGIHTSKHEDWIMQNSQLPDLLAKPPVSSTETVIISPELTSEGSDAERITTTFGKGRTKSKSAGISSPENNEWRVLNSQPPDLLAKSSVPFIEIAIVSVDRTTTISERSDADWITIRPGKEATKAHENEDWRTQNSQRPDLLDEPLIPAEEATIISPERTSQISETPDAEWITIGPGGGTTGQFEEFRDQPTFLPDDLPRDRFDDKYALRKLDASKNFLVGPLLRDTTLPACDSLLKHLSTQDIALPRKASWNTS